jgi:hypothetical protein
MSHLTLIILASASWLVGGLCFGAALLTVAQRRGSRGRNHELGTSSAKNVGRRRENCSTVQ